jgi:hypothetical protein
MNRRRERGKYHALLGSDEDISFMVRLQAQEKYFKGLLIPTALKSGLLLSRCLKSAKAVTAAFFQCNSLIPPILNPDVHISRSALQTPA